MPVFAEEGQLVTAEAVLAANGFERLLAVPALPWAGSGAPGYGDPLRLAPDRSQWTLSSDELQFTLIKQSWVRAGLLRVFSIGWGLSGGVQHGGVLLGEALLESQGEAVART
jgi:hypothetical protein